MALDKRGPLPNMALLRQAKAGAQGIAHGDWYIRLDNGEVMLESQVPIVNAHLSGKAEIDLDRLDMKWNYPKFIAHIDTHIQRLRVYFNSRKDRCIVQQIHHHQRMWRLSKAYACMEDVYFALANDIVSWSIEKPIPQSDH